MSAASESNDGWNYNVPLGDKGEAKDKDNSHSMNIAKLQTELEALRKAKVDIKFKLKMVGASTTANPGPCYFLESLPIEIRNRIYALLLRSPKLEDILSLDWMFYSYEGDSNETYGLSPTIMRTCRQIYTEASTILYETNVFAAHCSTLGFASPLDRYAWDCFEGDLGPLHKIKHWNVMVSARSKDYNRRIPAESVSWFCEKLCDSSPDSIRLCFTRENNLFDLPWDAEMGYNDWSHVLGYFGMLREIGRFSTTNVAPQGYSHSFDGNPFESLLGEEIPASNLENLKLLVEGDSPVERLPFMHNALILYATTFERCESFRKDMQIQIRPGSDRRDQRENYRSEAIKKGHLARGAPYQSNPFKKEPIHPVENILELAGLASGESKSSDFRGFRRQILTYLEPQFRRIIEASAVLHNFIAEAKPLEGEPTGENVFEKARDRRAMGLILVKEYANSFCRDMPLATRSKICLMQRTFDQIYSSMPREKLLERLADILEGYCEPGGGNFVDTFKAVVHDMNEQLESIQNARKALFNHDSAENLWSERDSWMDDFQLWNEADRNGMVRKTFPSHTHMEKICPPPEWKYSCQPGWGRITSLDAAYLWSDPVGIDIDSGDGIGDLSDDDDHRVLEETNNIDNGPSSPDDDSSDRSNVESDDSEAVQDEHNENLEFSDWSFNNASETESVEGGELSHFDVKWVPWNWEPTKDSAWGETSRTKERLLHRYWP